MGFDIAVTRVLIAIGEGVAQQKHRLLTCNLSQCVHSHHSDNVFVDPLLTEMFVVLMVDASVFTTTCNERDAHFVLPAKGRTMYQNMREGSAPRRLSPRSARRRCRHWAYTTFNVTDIDRVAPVRSILKCPAPNWMRRRILGVDN